MVYELSFTRADGSVCTATYTKPNLAWAVMVGIRETNPGIAVRILKVMA